MYINRQTDDVLPQLRHNFLIQYSDMRVQRGFGGLICPFPDLKGHKLGPMFKAERRGRDRKEREREREREREGERLQTNY